MRFPLFIDLDGKKAIVAGAGPVGRRRALILLEYGARVILAAPDACAADFAGIDALTVLARPVERADLEGAHIAVAATDDRQTNHAMALWCRSAGIPVSVADCPEECDFFFPAVAHAGKLSAGICSDGTDHTLVSEAAADIRTLLEENYGGR